MAKRGGVGGSQGTESSHQITRATWAETQARTSQISWLEFLISQPEMLKLPRAILLRVLSRPRHLQFPISSMKQRPPEMSTREMCLVQPQGDKNNCLDFDTLKWFRSSQPNGLKTLVWSLTTYPLQGGGLGGGVWPPKMHVTSIRLVIDFQRAGSSFKHPARGHHSLPERGYCRLLSSPGPPFSSALYLTPFCVLCCPGPHGLPASSRLCF